MDRGRFRRRVTAVVGVLGLLGALLVALTAAPAAATPISPSTSVCNYNGNPALVTGATAGMAVSVVCTGLPASASVALVESSPLAAVASPSNAAGGFVDTGHVVLGTTDATGAVTLAGVARTTAAAAPNNFTPANADPTATCPPTAAQINAGLVGCAFVVANVATMAPLNTATVLFAGQGTPATPTLALSPNPAVRGDVLAASDAASPTGNWWGAPITGAPSTTPAVPGFSVTVGGVAATNTLSASPAAECTTVAPAVGATVSPLCSGVTVETFKPPALSGSITVPTTVPAGTSAPVVVDEPNTTPDPGNGTLPAIIPGTVNVEGTATLAFSTQTLTASPAFATIPNTIALSGSGWDNQGSAITAAFSTASAGHVVDTASLAVHPDGTVSGTIALTANEQGPTPPSTTPFSNPIVGTQTAHGGQTLTATATFAVTSVSPSCATSGSPSSCTVNQFIHQSVAGDPLGLLLNEGATVPTVTMGPITLNGKVQTSTGSLSPIALTDNRGTLVGWSATAQFASDSFTCSGTGGAACPGAHPIDNTIPASNMLLVAPVVACADPGNPATVPPTPPSCVISEVTQATANHQVNGPGGAATSLGTAAAGGGGGSFTVNSPVSLLVPPFIAAGTYSNTLNITVT